MFFLPRAALHTWEHCQRLLAWWLILRIDFSNHLKGVKKSLMHPQHVLVLKSVALNKLGGKNASQAAHMHQKWLMILFFVFIQAHGTAPRRWLLRRWSQAQCPQRLSYRRLRSWRSSDMTNWCLSTPWCPRSPSTSWQNSWAKVRMGGHFCQFTCKFYRYGHVQGRPRLNYVLTCWRNAPQNQTMSPAHSTVSSVLMELAKEGLI